MAGRGDTVTRIEVIEGGKGGRGGVERRAEREIVEERGESFVFRNYERTAGGPRVTENGRGTFSIKPIITNSMGIWPVYGRRVRSPRRRN